MISYKCQCGAELESPDSLGGKNDTCAECGAVVNVPCLKKQGMNFVAIDFETANQKRSSACAVGLAFVENGEITNSYHRLINPQQEFAGINIGIHGIHPEDVFGMPTIDQVWKEIYPEIEGKFLVAHNASFDKSVLIKSLAEYGLDAPQENLLCSLDLAKAVLPSMTSHKLDVLSEHFGIELEHHNAESDAKACATIFMNLCQEVGIQAVEECIDFLGSAPKVKKPAKTKKKPEEQPPQLCIRLSEEVLITLPEDYLELIHCYDRLLKEIRQEVLNIMKGYKTVPGRAPLAHTIESVRKEHNIQW